MKYIHLFDFPFSLSLHLSTKFRSYFSAKPAFYYSCNSPFIYLIPHYLILLTFPQYAKIKWGLKQNIQYY